MAGKGSRFRKEGYKQYKPIIEVSKEPMVIKALDSLPISKNYRFCKQICSEISRRKVSN